MLQSCQGHDPRIAGKISDGPDPFAEPRASRSPTHSGSRVPLAASKSPRIWHAAGPRARALGRQNCETKPSSSGWLRACRVPRCLACQHKPVGTEAQRHRCPKLTCFVWLCASMLTGNVIPPVHKTHAARLLSSLGAFSW